MISARWLALSAALLGWMLDGAEQAIFPLIARPALQQMLSVRGDLEVGRWMGWLTAFFLLGAAAGGGVFGVLGDRLGRVRAMALSILVYSAFTGFCYFAQAPWELAVFRFAAALGMGGQWSLGVALVMETWPESHRPLLAGVIGAAGCLGFALIGVVAYCFPITGASWRWIMVVGAAPALLAFLIRMFVPESPRWEKAVGAVPAHPWHEVFLAPARRRTGFGIALASVVLIGTWGSVQWIPLWADRLTGGEVPSAKAVATILIALGAIVGTFAGSFLGRFGRRPAYCTLCLASYGVCWMLFKTVEVYGAWFKILTFFAGLTTSSFFGWLPLYLPELFSTRIRATGQGISYNAGRIFAAAGAVGAGQLVGHFSGDYARMGLTVTLIYLFGAVVIWAAPETKGKPLPD
jgi:MFS family permease